MSKGVQALMFGLFGIILSLLMWRITHSFVGWALMFIPGSCFIAYGLYRIVIVGDE